MPAHRHPLGLLALSLSLSLALATGASAADLMEVWRAASQNDRDLAVSRAAHAAAQPRQDQATALWRPQVGLSASVGVSNSDTQAQGAQFSAPGLGTNAGVGFNTSVTGGTATRWAVTAMQPLYNPERRAQQRQLSLSVEMAELEWQSAQQTLMLRTAQRYYELALAEESLRVQRLQHAAVQRAMGEVGERFRLGAVPVTDTHEAHARLAGIQAQVLLAENDLTVKRNLLADSTGLPVAGLTARLPDHPPAAAPAGPLPQWIQQAQVANPGVRLQALATELARQDVSKFALRSSATVDMVARASREHLSGSGAFGTASNTGANSMIGVQVSIPLWTGGYRNAKEQEALRLADQAAAQADRTRLEVTQQVRAAWLSLSISAERLSALTDSLVATEARLEATRLGQHIGHRTTQDLMNAENESASARLALAQAEVGLTLERLRLAALVGELNEDMLDAPRSEHL